MSTNYALIPAFMSSSRYSKVKKQLLHLGSLKLRSFQLFSLETGLPAEPFSNMGSKTTQTFRNQHLASQTFLAMQNKACWCLENTKPNMQGIAGFCSKIKCTVGSWVNNCDYAKNGNGCSVCPAWYVAMWCDHPTSHIHSQHRDQQQGWE